MAFSGPIPNIRNPRTLKTDMWDRYPFAVKMKVFVSKPRITVDGINHQSIIYLNTVLNDKYFPFSATLYFLSIRYI